MNPENSVSENFLGEERNFPRFGPGMNPSPPSAARATFLALIVGNSVPPLENFRKHYIYGLYLAQHAIISTKMPFWLEKHASFFPRISTK